MGWVRRLFGLDPPLAADAAETKDPAPEAPEPAPLPMPDESRAVRREFHTRVAGVSYANADGSSRQATILLCQIGEAVSLVPEPNNQYDPFAVKVCRRRDGRQIGYLPSGHTMLDDIKDGRIGATIASSRLPHPGAPYFGVVLLIRVYERQ